MQRRVRVVWILKRRRLVKELFNIGRRIRYYFFSYLVPNAHRTRYILFIVACTTFPTTFFFICLYFIIFRCLQSNLHLSSASQHTLFCAFKKVMVYAVALSNNTCIVFVRFFQRFVKASVEENTQLKCIFFHRRYNGK